MKAHPLEVLRRRTSEKWRTHPEDVLPMFVAEMDFPLAPAIRAVLHEAVENGDTGYVDPHDRAAATAFSQFSADAWGWEPDPARTASTTDVSVVVVESIRRLTRPGDGVVITPPVYPPFFDLVPEAGARAVQVPLAEGPDGPRLDLDGIFRALAAGARGVLLCNPHNPLGLVHSREDLTELSRIVDRHAGFVVSDEIHAPLTHHGVAFTPYLTVSPQARAHGIAAESASKAFNLAGLKCALFVAESEAMAEVVKDLPEEVVFRTGLFGARATEAGFAQSREWLHDLVETVQRNVSLLEGQLREKLPAVRSAPPRASYLAWLDLSALGWGDDPAQVALRQARVALASGPAFGRQGTGFARMNLACAPETVVEAVDRLAAAHRNRR